MHHAHLRRVVSQRLAGVGRGVQHHLFRSSESHHFTTRITSLWPQVDQPVGSANDVQVVLDHQQRMPRVHQFAQGAHQFGNVIEVQASGGLIQHKQDATPRHCLAAGRTALGRISEETCKL